MTERELAEKWVKDNKERQQWLDELNMFVKKNKIEKRFSKIWKSKGDQNGNE
jgi:hypothetical protein